MTEKDYVPVDCAFHDRLEALATLRRRCELQIRDPDGRMRTVTTRIVDVYARAGEEFAVLDGGETVRLDRISLVDPR